MRPFCTRRALLSLHFVLAGLIKVFSSVTSTDPPVVAVDLTNVVDTPGDRGILGVSIRPTMTPEGYLQMYVTYTVRVGANVCAVEPCVANSRLSRWTIGPDSQIVPGSTEEILIDNVGCQEFYSHSIGDCFFDEAGVLYVAAGEGASYSAVDFGNLGNLCGSPPATTPGQNLIPPNAEGGALRAQHYRSAITPWQPAYHGSMLRLNALDGTALNSTAGFKPGDTSGRNRILAYGMRNPYSWKHSAPPNPDGLCSAATGKTGSAISALQFYNGPYFPAQYKGALFFADYAIGCVWAMLKGPTGAPDPNNIVTVIDGIASVDLQSAPLSLGGGLYTVNFYYGAIYRIAYNNEPLLYAAIVVDTLYGVAPHACDFDSSQSAGSPPITSYAWDFNGDGVTESTAASATYTYTVAGVYQARLTVFSSATSATATKKISILNSNSDLPTAAITYPADGGSFVVNQVFDCTAQVGPAVTITYQTVPSGLTVSGQNPAQPSPYSVDGNNQATRVVVNPTTAFTWTAQFQPASVPWPPPAAPRVSSPPPTPFPPPPLVASPPPSPPPTPSSPTSPPIGNLVVYFTLTDTGSTNVVLNTAPLARYGNGKVFDSGTRGLAAVRTGNGYDFQGLGPGYTHINFGDAETPPVLTLSSRQITLAAFIKVPTKVFPPNTYQNDYDILASYHGGMVLRFSTKGGNNFMFGSAPTDTGVSLVNHSAVAFVKAADRNRFVHLVGVYNGGSYRIYKDGKLINAKAEKISFSSVSDAVITAFVRVYNTALSAAQVSALYSSFQPVA
eukprot:jgi/Chlat1/8189/Chrsp76S09205